MSKRARFLLFALCLGLITWGTLQAIRLFPIMFNERAQVITAQEELMQCIVDGDWKKFEESLHPDYSDQWEMDRVRARRVLHELRRQFFALGITSEKSLEPVFLTEQEMDLPTATVEYIMRLDGQGAGVSHSIVTQANRIKEPFTYTWVKTGRSPLSWKVIRLSHPNLPVSKTFLHQISEGGVSY